MTCSQLRKGRHFHHVHLLVEGLPHPLLALEIISIGASSSRFTVSVNSTLRCGVVQKLQYTASEISIVVTPAARRANWERFHNTGADSHHKCPEEVILDADTILAQDLSVQELQELFDLRVRRRQDGNLPNIIANDEVRAQLIAIAIPNNTTL